MLRQFSKATQNLTRNISEPRNKFAALWGNGDFGRLGLGDFNSRFTPVACSAFADQSLRAVVCGGAHTLFLTESGRVYASGLNDFGQLGVPNDIEYTAVPLEISGFTSPVIQISASYYHSCAITADGELFMWGKNSNGQLGFGKRAAKAVKEPCKIDCLSGISIKMAALGSEHTLAVTGDGEVLSWGAGGSGRLGHGHHSSFFGSLRSTSEYTPRLIKNLEGIKVKNVAAGLVHSACIAEDGSVFIFGEQTVNKLGFTGGNNATTPSMIGKLPYSEQIACGGYHTCVITSGRELFTWGSNENGCLGIGCTYAIHSPERVEDPFLQSSVYLVSCGWKHTAAISEGSIFTWGWGGSNGTFSEDGLSSGGQLGHGDDVDYIKPTMVNFGSNVKASQVSCGFNHTAAILEYTEGHNL